jgi:hypothetical protein
MRGRVRKQVTNGSETAVMDVIGFLFVSLGSSTVQLCDNLHTRHACAYSRLVSVVKMVTELEECTTEKQRSVVCFFLCKRTQHKGYS